MKTLDINAKEWFDKTNGNSYFSARVVIDYSLPTEQTILIPFQYGYGDHYIYMCMQELKKLGLTNYDRNRSLTDSGVIVRCNKQTGCLKREVINYAK